MRDRLAQLAALVVHQPFTSIRAGPCKATSRAGAGRVSHISQAVARGIRNGMRSIRRLISSHNMRVVVLLRIRLAARCPRSSGLVSSRVPCHHCRAARGRKARAMPMHGHMVLAGTTCAHPLHMLTRTLQIAIRCTIGMTGSQLVSRLTSGVGINRGPGVHSLSTVAGSSSHPICLTKAAACPRRAASCLTEALWAGT